MTFITAAHMVQALHLLYDADIVTSLYSEPTLVIDTSFGSTVGVVGYKPLYEPDSRSHVELLQPHIAQVLDDARLKPSDIKRIVVGTGPAPFTGLRAGIVAARAMAFATGAQILGMDILSVQSAWQRLETRNLAQFDDGVAAASHEVHYTLAVNDARRKQLYFALYDDLGKEIIEKDIASAADIAQRMADVVNDGVLVDIIGHGTAKYASAFNNQPWIGQVREESVLHDAGAAGLAIFAAQAVYTERNGQDVSDEPLYLRRPDVTIPAPSKHILGQTAISMPVGGLA